MRRRDYAVVLAMTLAPDPAEPEPRPMFEYVCPRGTTG
jgi:hypothetical protein